MNIAIDGIGLATAQGGVANVLRSAEPRLAAEVLWTPNPWNVSTVCYPALGLDSSLHGVERWQALANKALADVGGTSKTPLLVASCNGSAAENWEESFEVSDRPVFSSSCASGVHALYAARQLLTAGAVDEVLVLAADILAQSNHENFESLRVLAEKPGAPWQSTSSGFILGEAAVVLKLVRANDDAETILHGPELGSDLRDVIGALSPPNPQLILGQGTGPYANDAAELAAFASCVEKKVPVATPLSHFGHTLGASGLLSIALGALTYQKRSVFPSLTSDVSETMDHRPICRGGTPWPPGAEILATCRAINGACGAARVGGISRAKAQRRKGTWEKSMVPGPLMNPTLRRLASEAIDRRPSTPPDVLILRVEKPLVPASSAIIGKRLLPSAVLEITPGFASQLVARCWGFNGAALCLVGNIDTDPYGLTNACRESGQNVFQLNLRGTGENRAIEWNV